MHCQNNFRSLRISEIKHAEKMVKICRTGLPKLNFETKTKKMHFPVLFGS